MIPYGRQSISEADIEEVVRTLRSDFLTTGPAVAAFEQDLAAVCKAEHAVVVSSCTAALHLALAAHDIGAGKRVMTSPITFVASANAAAFVGAIPDFVDVSEEFPNLAPESLEAHWKEDIGAVIAVDYAGSPVDIESISATAHARGAIVIEDACHALGSEAVRKDGSLEKVGSRQGADVTCFSFHPVKTITSGEGGALLTNDPDIAERVRRLRSHGIVRDPAAFSGPSLQERANPWYHEMQELGWNYRLSDLQCALGRSQLRRLEEFVDRRLQIVESYNAAFSTHPFVRPLCKLQATRTSWHLYVVRIDFPAVGRTRAQVMEQLRQRGVGSQVHYIPVHLQPWYRESFGYTDGKCPAAERFYADALSLPLYPEMTDRDVEHVITSLLEILVA